VKKKMADKAGALRKEEEELKLLVSDARELGKKITAISDKISEQAGDEKFRQALEKQQQELKSQQQKLEVQIAESKVKVAELKGKGEEEIQRLKDDVASLKAQQLAHMTDSLRTPKLNLEYVQKEVAQGLVGEPLVALPSLSTLSDRLNRPIDVFFPVDGAVVESARRLYAQQRGQEWGGPPTRFSFLETSLNRRVDPQHLRIEYVFDDARTIIGGQSEDATHAVITPLVQYFLGGLLNLTNPVWYGEVRFARNEAENKRSRTTIESLRPDWMLMIRQLLVIRGEEKGDSSRATLRDAANELTSKMEAWNPLFFGELPYVFGYALAGTKFQLYALHPDGSVHYLGGACGVRQSAIGRQLDLTFLDDRFVLLQYMINLVRVLQVMEPLVPHDAPPLGDMAAPWKRPESGEYSRIVFEPGFVIKILVQSSVGPVQYDFDLLETLYAKVKSGSIRNLIMCQKDYPKYDEGGNMILHLFPVGLSILPKDVRELGVCLRAVLTALGDLHESQFCHRDVRWPNILRNVDTSWMLIDLDFAAKLKRKKADWPTWTRGVPTRIGKEQWSAQHDLKQVSALLSDAELRWFDARQQLALDIAECATAKAAVEIVKQHFHL
jgi:hypothetical protein